MLTAPSLIAHPFLRLTVLDYYAYHQAVLREKVAEIDENNDAIAGLEDKMKSEQVGVVVGVIALPHLSSGMHGDQHFLAKNERVVAFVF